jgi:enamine deaminase RidA (YjgF/YER057c/UK114 family)
MMTDTISGRVRALGLELPQTAAPAANYVPFVVVPPLVFLAGQIAQFNGNRPYLGKVGGTLSLEDGVRAAELCGLNILAWIAAVVEDDPSRIQRCVRLGGFVNCVPEFTDQPKVINGASDLVVKVLGDKGRHARTAVGSNSLPFDVAVEIDAIFEIR